MIKNYLKIALRTLRWHSGYAFINVFGFAVGLACCLFILLYVRHELSYDRHHDKADRIHRLTIDAFLGGQEFLAPLSAAPLSASLVEEFPEVEHSTRVFRSTFVGMKEMAVEYEENRFLESRFYYVDSTFFDVFSHSVLLGVPEELLAEPNTVVLTRRIANKYFGNVNPVGKTIRVNDESDMRVTGVIDDVPAASHWHFDILASLSTLPISNSPNWLGNPFTTYIVLKEGADVELFEAKLAAFVKDQVSPVMKEVLGIGIEDFFANGGRYEFATQPLLDIHLRSNLSYELQSNSDIRYVYTFSIIAMLILVIAVFNFMNLATARSTNRSREVGIRKVLGSNRLQLIGQFLMESMVLCLISMVVALAVVWLLMPYLNQWIGLDITMPVNSPWFIVVMGTLVCVVGLLSGAYPAFYLTGLVPARVLKAVMQRGSKNGRLRSGLVITQFMISIVLMIATAVAYQQMQFIQNKKLGYDREHVLVLDRGATANNQSTVFKEEIERLPGVLSAAGIDHIPGKLFEDDVFRTLDAPASDLNVVWVINADEDIVETLGMNMVIGEGFNLEAVRDSSLLVLNQTAAALFEWEYPIGQKLASPFAQPEMPERIYTVAGVLENFHYQTLHENIKPLAIELSNTADMEYMAIRTAPGQAADVLEPLEALWNQFYPQDPFSLTFLDDHVNLLYEEDRVHGQLLTVFAGLAIFIACLGLFGLAAYMTEQRFKEVGVRKVMGASASSIVFLFSKDILKRVAIAFLIGIPIALYVTDQWMARFAYRADISWDVFIIPGVLALFITLATISFHTVRAAFLNPVETLKYE